MSQFDKDDVEALGLLKLDVLGIRMQSAMAYAVDEVARVDGAGRPQDGEAPDDATYLDADGRIDLDAVRSTTRPPTGSSAPPTRSAASRSSRRGSGSWSASSRRDVRRPHRRHLPLPAPAR
jgi:hypothetical protein